MVVRGALFEAKELARECHLGVVSDRCRRGRGNGS